MLIYRAAAEIERIINIHSNHLQKERKRDSIVYLPINQNLWLRTTAEISNSYLETWTQSIGTPQLLNQSIALNLSN